MSELEIDYDDDDIESSDDTEETAVVLKSMDTRRKIEDLLERKRLREEFGDIDF